MNQALLFNVVFAAVGFTVHKLSKSAAVTMLLIGQLVPYLVFGHSLLAATGTHASDIWTISLTTMDIPFISSIDAGRGIIIFGLAPLFLLLSVGVILQRQDGSQIPAVLSARIVAILLAQAGALGLISAGSVLNYIIFWPLLLGAGLLSLVSDVAGRRSQLQVSNSSQAVGTSADNNGKQQDEQEDVSTHLQDGAITSYLTVALLSCLIVMGALIVLSTSLGSFEPAIIKETVMTDLKPVQQWWFLLTLLVGLGLWAPLFPLHAWTRVIGPTSSPVTDTILFGITGKLGLLLLAVCGQVMSDAFVPFRQALFIVGILTTLYMVVAAFGAAPRTGHLYLAAASSGVMLITLGEFSPASLTSFGYGLITLPYTVFYLSILIKQRHVQKEVKPERDGEYTPATSITAAWLSAMASFGIGTFLPGSPGFVWLTLTAIALINQLPAAAALTIWLIVNGMFVIHQRQVLAAQAAELVQARRIDYILVTVVTLAFGIFPAPLVRGIFQWVQTQIG